MNYNFLKLNQGSNLLRIITLPYQYICHPDFTQKENGGAHEQRLKCCISNCDLCKNGYKPMHYWMVGVISRLDNKFYLLNINYSIYKQIRKLATHQYWGDPESYEVDFILGKNKITIIPTIKNFLSEEDFVLKNNIDKNILEELCVPPKELAQHYNKRTKLSEIDIRQIMNRFSGCSGCSGAYNCETTPWNKDKNENN